MAGSHCGEKFKAVSEFYHRPHICQETTREVLKLHFRGKKTKLSDEAAQAVAEVARLAIVEATLRAGKQARTEASSTIQPEHFEKVLPQLMLDL